MYIYIYIGIDLWWGTGHSLEHDISHFGLENGISLL